MANSFLTSAAVTHPPSQYHFRPLSTSVFKSGPQVVTCLQEELHSTLTFSIGLASISPGTICYHLSFSILFLVLLEDAPSK